MNDNNDDFIKAYHDFKRSVDFTKGGILPEKDDLTWCVLMGIPSVPADEDSSEGGPMIAVDQRISILKAVFVEVNKDQPEDFINKGLLRYDESGKIAKEMLEEGNLPLDLK
jgi:hypothetical protein